MGGSISESGLIPLMILLSGDAPTLPMAECLAVLDATEQPYQLLKQEGRLLRILSTPSAPQIIRDRCAYSHWIAQEIFQSPGNLDHINQRTKQVHFSSIMPDHASFAVRIKAIDGAERKGQSPNLEREIGQIIVEQTGNKVRLTNPDFTFYGIITPQAFHFGTLVTKTYRDDIAKHKPSTRAFFKPSSMNPLLARALANLLRVRPQTIILDPFCGTGGLLLEAFHLGARIIAIELDTKTVAGAKQNLKTQGHVIKGDARFLPLRVCHGILTDPPYGRSASTKGVPLPSLIQDFLSSVTSRLSMTELVCITFPMHFPFKRLLKPESFDCLEEHSVFVHSSLTRRIYLLKRRAK